MNPFPRLRNLNDHKRTRHPNVDFDSLEDNTMNPLYLAERESFSQSQLPSAQPTPSQSFLDTPSFTEEGPLSDVALPTGYTPLESAGGDAAFLDDETCRGYNSEIQRLNEYLQSIETTRTYLETQLRARRQQLWNEATNMNSSQGFF